MALGYVSVPTQTAKIHHQEQNTEIFIDQNCLGRGVVYITEDNVVCKLEDGTGFELLYPNIQLHAISRDKNAFNKDCLYLMVEGHILPISTMETNGGDGDQTSEDEDAHVQVEEDEDLCCEVRFCPDNVLDLEPMFQAMNQCQELHPDPTMNDSDDSGECDLIEEMGGGDRVDAPQNEVESEASDTAVTNLQQYFTSDGQFNDAILQQLQSGQQVHIDFLSGVTTTSAAPNNSAPNGDGNDVEMEPHSENNRGAGVD